MKKWLSPLLSPLRLFRHRAVSLRRRNIARRTEGFPRRFLHFGCSVTAPFPCGGAAFNPFMCKTGSGSIAYNMI